MKNPNIHPHKSENKINDQQQQQQQEDTIKIKQKRNNHNPKSRTQNPPKHPNSSTNKIMLGRRKPQVTYNSPHQNRTKVQHSQPKIKHQKPTQASKLLHELLDFFFSTILYTRKLRIPPI